ncbi:MAG: LLM class flavin-dependent oxidoreductase [Chloroflexi bacterium]|nr:LLM class flavin-dependent oxidoreductase [Chloroflexota bacterium]
MPLQISAHIVAPDAPGLIDAIVAADQAGLDTAWLTVGGPAPDPFAVFAAAAQRAERINLGTSIVPTFPRHPIATAQGAMTVDQIAPGRLKLGVGPSHKGPVESMWGIPFVKPLSHLREYVTILNALLGQGEVDFDGDIIQAHARIAAPTQVSVMIAALREKAFHLSGELTDGGISWMAPLPYIRDVAAPAQQAGANAAGRPKPAMVVHTPIVVSENREAILAAARRQFGFYQRMPYYSQMLLDAGYEEAAGKDFSDRMIDALVISGSANEVADRVRALPEFGVDEMLAALVELGDADPDAADRTLALLGELNQEG